MKRKQLIPMRLNFFSEETPPAGAADDPGASPGAAPADPPPPAGEPAKEPTIPALPDVEKIIGDKLAEWENKQTEAQKLAKMTAEEKAEYERESRERDYAKRLAELTKKELRIEAHKTLTDKGLPIELLDALQYENADQCNASISAVEKAFRSAVEKGINDRLRGKNPPASNGSNTPLTLERIKGMSQAEIMANMGEIEKALAQQ